MRQTFSTIFNIAGKIEIGRILESLVGVWAFYSSLTILIFHVFGNSSLVKDIFTRWVMASISYGLTARIMWIPISSTPTALEVISFIADLTSSLNTLLNSNSEVTNKCCHKNAPTLCRTQKTFLFLQNTYLSSLHISLKAVLPF